MPIRGVESQAATDAPKLREVTGYDGTFEEAVEVRIVRETASNDVECLAAVPADSRAGPSRRGGWTRLGT